MELKLLDELSKMLSIINWWLFYQENLRCLLIFFEKHDEEGSRNIRRLIEEEDIDGTKDFSSEKFTEDMYYLTFE